MKKCLPLLTFCCICIHGYAVGNSRGGARALAMSDAFIAVSDAWGTFHNQAGLASIKSFAAGVHSSSRFSLKELKELAGTMVIKTQTGTFGFSYWQFGYQQYRETRLGIAYAKPLAHWIFAGIQIDYLSRLLPENSKAGGFPAIEGGIIIKAGEKLNLGAHIFNPVNLTKFTRTSQFKVPLIVRTGVAFSVSQMLLITAEMEKRPEEKMTIKSGLEYVPIENLTLRFGVSGNPFTYTAGMGYTVNKITTNIAIQYQGNLGLTPGISINYLLQ